jgi:hypothetical protein
MEPVQMWEWKMFGMKAEDVETVGVFELDPVALQQQIKAKKVIYSGVMSGVIAAVTM